MTAVWVLTVATVVLAVVATRAASRDYHRGDILKPSTVTVVWLTYLLAGTAVVMASWSHTWSLSIPPVVGWVIGGVMIAAGTTVLSRAVVRFQSIKQLSGREPGQLVTSGVYRWSRNPQNVGLLLAFAGVGVAGRSGLAVLLTTTRAVLLRSYLPSEEAHLERAFGDSYRRYREETSRWFSLSGDIP